MMDKLLPLYDTFLARFSFFRRHIQALIELNNQVTVMSSEIQNLIEMVEILNEDNKELSRRCEELERALDNKPKTSETSRDFIRTSQDIMQSIYSNYYVTGEPLPDRSR